MKLTSIMLEAVINTAERHPHRRGPWVFDETELQAAAAKARIALKEQGRDN